MKKLARTSMIYMIFGLFAGLFYREFTRAIGYTGETQLSVLHTHALALGMLFFLFVLLLERNFQLSEQKHYRKFLIFYNGGLGITLLIMMVHGSIVALGNPESAALAGIAGIGHILLTVGLGFFFYVLIKAVGNKEQSIA